MSASANAVSVSLVPASTLTAARLSPFVMPRLTTTIGMRRRRASSMRRMPEFTTSDDPVLKARRALKALPAGAVLEVLADDPAAPADFRSFCQTAGCTLETTSEGKAWRFRIAKAA